MIFAVLYIIFGIVTAFIFYHVFNSSFGDEVELFMCALGYGFFWPITTTFHVLYLSFNKFHDALEHQSNVKKHAILKQKGTK